MSPTQCCAHACGQPSRCRRSAATLVSEALLEPSDQRIEPRLRLGDRVVAVRLAGAGDAVPAEPAELERQAQVVEHGDDAVHLVGGNVREKKVLLPRDPRTLRRAARAGPRARRGARLLSRPTCTGTPTLRSPSGCGADAEVVVGLDVDRRKREGRQRVAEPLLDLCANAIGPERVDHELHPRLHTRDPPAEVVAPGVEDRAEHRDAPRPDGRRRRGRGRSEGPRKGRRRRARRSPGSPSRSAPTSEMQLISGALQREAQAEIEILCLRGRST